MNDLDDIAAFFDAQVQRHGASPRAADWGSAESQRLRFDVMAAVAPLAGMSVLDVGCGPGDFAAHLGDHDSYLGVDLSPGMIEAARGAHPDRAFRVANLLEEDVGEHDVVVANGIFYRLRAAPEDTMKRLVERLWEHARVAVAFTSLSTLAPEPDPEEFHADPFETARWATTLTPRVTLRCDYHPRDFAVYLYREPAA